MAVDGQVSTEQIRSIAHDLQAQTFGGIPGIESAPVVPHLDDPFPVVPPQLHIELFCPGVTDRRILLAA